MVGKLFCVLCTTHCHQLANYLVFALSLCCNMNRFTTKNASFRLMINFQRLFIMLSKTRCLKFLFNASFKINCGRSYEELSMPVSSIIARIPLQYLITCCINYNIHSLFVPKSNTIQQIIPLSSCKLIFKFSSYFSLIQ